MRKLIGMVNRSETNVLKLGGLVLEKADHHGGLIYLKSHGQWSISIWKCYS